MNDTPKLKVVEIRRVTVWRAILNGECKLIHKSERELWDELTHRNFWHRQTDESDWTVKASEEELPVVIGEAHDWAAEGGQGGVHIHWDCPYCLETHYVDDDPTDCSPYLWFCDWGRGIALVTLKRSK